MRSEENQQMLIQRSFLDLFQPIGLRFAVLLHRFIHCNHFDLSLLPVN